jgi:hypothetical protein
MTATATKKRQARSAITYTKDDGAAATVADRLLKLFYRDLEEAEVTIEILHASGGLKHHGYAAAATVKINSLKDRAAGLADCRIILDGDGWEKWDTKRRQAVLDHELFHLEVQRDQEDEIKSDDLGRPKLRLKLHDHQLGIFEEIILRNKEHSIDAQVIAKSWAKVKQLQIDWDAAELMENPFDREDDE